MMRGVACLTWWIEGWEGGKGRERIRTSLIWATRLIMRLCQCESSLVRKEEVEAWRAWMSVRSWVGVCSVGCPSEESSASRRNVVSVSEQTLSRN